MTKNRTASAEMESTLGKGISIKGRISGKGSLAIGGLVDGQIEVGGSLLIESGAKVQAAIQASGVTVEGQLDGDIVSSGPVHVGAGASYSGRIEASSFSMEEGANVSALVEANFDLPRELMGR